MAIAANFLISFLFKPVSFREYFKLLLTFFENFKVFFFKVENIFKVGEGRPNVVDGIKNGEIALVINTPFGAMARYDEEAIGRASIQKGIVAITTLSAASAAVRALRSNQKEEVIVRSLQEYHA